eukprot:TRINITY_DN1603_c0_g1_i1.p1 TRINITY_DN1603_c0_g1~~TRINITY_DN1603_c0_g1_i1.p1  ORF type:complete len:221 (-),score=50.59 TRINITY_DN1603_c0_g1_i1:107-748(-)
MEPQEEYGRSAAGDEGIVLKVGMVGDLAIGKTSLMVKYIKNTFDEDYIQTLGVNFMERTVQVRGKPVTFSIFDLGGHKDFVNMMPLVCNEAVAILFMFDLTRPATLSSIKAWFNNAREINEHAFAILVGTKYDMFAKLDRSTQEETCRQARKFAKTMQAPLFFSSAQYAINIKKIFKIVLAKAFGLRSKIEEINEIGHPLIEFWDTRREEETE